MCSDTVKLATVGLATSMRYSSRSASSWQARTVICTYGWNEGQGAGGYAARTAGQARQRRNVHAPVSHPVAATCWAHMLPRSAPPTIVPLLLLLRLVLLRGGGGLKLVHYPKPLACGMEM